MAQELRALVQQTIPNSTELVYPGWRLIGYKVVEQRRKAYFGFIAPMWERVLLGFEYGLLLSDPDRLLEGDGKQVRYVTIEHPEDIRRKEFAALITEAAQVAAASQEKKAQLFLERDAMLEARKQGFT